MGCAVRGRDGRASLLIMPDAEVPGQYVLRIQGNDGDGAILLGSGAAQEVAKVLGQGVDGAWLELRLRAAFRAGCNRAMVPSSDTVIPTEDQFVAAELARAVPPDPEESPR